MKMIASCLAALTTLFAFTLGAHALGIGDPAPKLAQGKYVQGEPVKEFEKGKVYVMEFWATWCGPCIAAIPHVNELQQKYADKGLIVIGQNVWERDREDSKVEPFVKNMGEKMSYRIALDDKSGEARGAMAITWMMAANRNGIPCSMIVNQEGIIAWIGHPMTMDKPLEQIIAGTWDLAKAKADGAAEAKVNAAQMELSKAMQAKDWEKAIGLIDAMEPAAAKRYQSTKLIALANAGQAEKVKAIAEAQLADKDATPMSLIQLSSALLSANSVDLAERAATAAVERGPKEAQAHYVLGRVYAQRGQLDKAIASQKQAVELAPDQLQTAMKQILANYEAKAAKAAEPKAEATPDAKPDAKPQPGTAAK